MLKPTIFREYDIRGIADAELLSPDIETLGLGIGTFLQRRGQKKINLGRDTLNEWNISSQPHYGHVDDRIDSAPPQPAKLPNSSLDPGVFVPP